MSAFTHKLVGVLNKQIETGVALNALGHICLGLGSQLEKDTLRLDNYKDADENVYPNISQMPFIVLRAKSNEIRKTVQAAREKGFLHGVFLNTMTGGTYQEQLDNTAKTQEADLIYYGCVLYGPWEEVSSLTKRFSLWK